MATGRCGAGCRHKRKGGALRPARSAQRQLAEQDAQEVRAVFAEDIADSAYRDLITLAQIRRCPMVPLQASAEADARKVPRTRRPRLSWVPFMRRSP